jgi:hypothetical protein
MHLLLLCKVVWRLSCRCWCQVCHCYCTCRKGGARFSTPDIAALRDANRVAGLLECDGIKDIKIIVNRVWTDLVKGEDMMSALDVQEMLGLPLLGVVPEDAEVIRSTNRGVPLVLNDPPTPAGLALEQATGSWWKEMRWQQSWSRSRRGPRRKATSFHSSVGESWVQLWWSLGYRWCTGSWSGVSECFTYVLALLCSRLERFICCDGVEEICNSRLVAWCF